MKQVSKPSIIKVYADVVENKTKKFNDIPEKFKLDVYEELENRVKNGELTSDELDILLENVNI